MFIDLARRGLLIAYLESKVNIEKGKLGIK